MNKIEIRAFGGKSLGYVVEESNGNKKALDFGGKILGTYDKSTNTTRKFGGKIVAIGDVVSGFLLKDID